MARDMRGRAASGVAWGRAQGDRVLEGVPAARRLVTDLLRVEVIDRSMALAAQALLALVPLLVVAAAFLPDAVIQAGYERLQAVTGLRAVQTSHLAQSMSTGVDAANVRTQVGLVGVLITVLSATSYSRATQRAYEKVWAVRHFGGLASWKRSLVWLLGWLVGLQAIAVIDRLFAGGSPAQQVADFTLRCVLVSLLWWWSLRYLLSDRVRWVALVPAAAVTGVAAVAFAAASTVVMPAYAASSAEEFGGFGLVLTLATWLVGLSGIQVVAAVVGRVIAEDPWLAALTRRTVGFVRAEAAKVRQRS
jgi:membrane protein